MKAERELDRAWLENALTFLGVCTTSDGGVDQWEGISAGGITREGRDEYLTSLVRDIRTAADGLEDGK